MALATDDNEMIDSAVVPPVISSRKRKRQAIPSPVDDLYAAFLKSQMEVDELKKVKLRLEIQLLKKKLAE